MFIRQTITRRTADKEYASFRLVEAARTGKRVQQKTLLNLGSQFTVPRERWRELVGIIKMQLDGRIPLLEPDPELAQVADGIVRQLRNRGLKPVPARDDPGWESVAGRTAEVDLDSVGCEDVRSAGCERLALSSLTTLGLTGILEDLGMSTRDGRIALALVIARMVHPSSEREGLRWLLTNSSALELLGLDGGPSLKLDKLYRISDALQSRRHAIEDAVFARQRTLLGSSGAVIFYDLTNTHLTGRPASPLAKFGRSKQRRNDCPLVTLALALDGNGVPRRSHVLPGNVSEPGTLAAALDGLATQGEDGGRPTVIMDAGVSTEANLALLRERGHHWITVRRSGVTAAWASDAASRDADARLRTSSGHEALVWRLARECDGNGTGVDDGDGGSDAEMHLCIWSQARQDREEAILARKRERTEAELAHLHAGLGKKGYVKRYDRVLERIGRLRERYPTVHGQYDISVEKGEKGLASSVSWTRNAKFANRDTRAGLHVLRTSHTDWDLEETVSTYWKLTEVEATFESLKSELGLRPVWHQLTHRIEGHLFIAVLALHGVALIRSRLGTEGIHDSWSMLRHKLARWQRVTTTMTGVDGSRLEVRHDARPDPEACAIGRAAGVSWQADRRSRRLRGRRAA